MIASAADEIVQACALAAENDDEVAGEVEAVVVGCAAFVETNDPEVALLQFFEGADEVDDTGNSEVLGCSRARFERRGAERGGTAFRKNDAIDAGAVGNAKQRAKILRIFDAIERKDKPRDIWACRRRIKQIFNGERFLRTDQRDDALVRSRFGDGGELLAGFRTDADAGLAALRDEALQAVVLAFAGDQYLIEAAAAGFKCFLDRMQAVENVHMKIVVGNARLIADCTSRLTSCQVIEL
jgi:hypothetical protein